MVDLDDSGPYEEIDEDDYEDHLVANTRPPLGRLPSYISLSSSASNANMSTTTTSSQFVVENQVEEPDEEFEERLIWKLKIQTWNICIVTTISFTNILWNYFSRLQFTEKKDQPQSQTIYFDNLVLHDKIYVS